MNKAIPYSGLAALGFIFIAGAVFTSLGVGHRVIAAGFCAGLLTVFFAAPKLSRLQNELLARSIVYGATLLLGALWLVFTRVSPYMEAAQDFSRLYETAAAYAIGGSPPDPEYMALFPHLKGYPLFLSLFFRVFGVSVTVAQGFNLLCSVFSAVLIFEIGKKLAGVTGGLFAGLLWAALPSRFMILSLTASEPLHIMLTLLAIWGYYQAIDRLDGRWREVLSRWLLVGAAVGVSSLVRPVGPIYLLAFALCAVVFHRKRRLLAALPLMLAAYLIVTVTVSGGFGWNLYIGMNRGSAGGWNAADYAVLEARLDEGMSAVEIQSSFRREGFQRLGDRLAEGFGFLRFMANKFTKLWSQDSFIVYWLAQGMTDGSPIDIQSHAGTLALLCNIAYGFLLGCCALSLFRQIKSGGDAFILPVTVLTGIVLLFLLLEANPRYRYAGSAVLCLLTAGAVQFKEKVIKEC
jgi:4-amino-4-deoxy-L-arabinose transferase-like glycosyltransferase